MEQPKWLETRAARRGGFETKVLRSGFMPLNGLRSKKKRREQFFPQSFQLCPLNISGALIQVFGSNLAPLLHLTDELHGHGVAIAILADDFQLANICPQGIENI